MIGAGEFSQKIKDKLDSMVRGAASLGCGAGLQYTAVDTRPGMGTGRCEDSYREALVNGLNKITDETAQDIFLDYMAPYVFIVGTTNCEEEVVIVDRNGNPILDSDGNPQTRPPTPAEQGSCFEATVRYEHDATSGYTGTGTNDPLSSAFKVNGRAPTTILDPPPERTARKLLLDAAEQIRMGRFDPNDIGRKAAALMDPPKVLADYINQIKGQYPAVAREAKRLFYEALAKVKPMEQFDAAPKIAEQVVAYVGKPAASGTPGTGLMAPITGPNDPNLTMVRRTLMASYVYDVGVQPNFVAEFRNWMLSAPQNLLQLIPADRLGDILVGAIRRHFVDALEIYRRKDGVKPVLAGAKDAMLGALGVALTNAIVERGKTNNPMAMADDLMRAVRVQDVEVDGAKRPVKVIFSDRAKGVPDQLIDRFGARGNALMIDALEDLWESVLKGAPEIENPTNDQQRALRQALIDDLGNGIDDMLTRTNAEAKDVPFKIVMQEVTGVDKQNGRVSLRDVPWLLIGTGNSLHDLRDLDSTVAMRVYLRTKKNYEAYTKAQPPGNDTERNIAATRLRIRSGKLFEPNPDGELTPRDVKLQQAGDFFYRQFVEVDPDGWPILEIVGREEENKFGARRVIKPEKSNFDAGVQGEYDPSLLSRGDYGHYLEFGGFLGYKGKNIEVHLNAYGAHILGSGLINVEGVGYNTVSSIGDQSEGINLSRVNQLSLSLDGKWTSPEAIYRLGIVAGPVISGRPLDRNFALTPDVDIVLGLGETLASSRVAGFKGTFGLGLLNDKLQLALGGMYATEKAYVGYNAEADDGKGRGVFEFPGHSYGVWGGFLYMGEKKKWGLQGDLSYVGGTVKGEDRSLFTASVSAMVQVMDNLQLVLGGRYNNWMKEEDKSRLTIGGAAIIPTKINGYDVTFTAGATYSNKSWPKDLTQNTPASGCEDGSACEEGNEVDYHEGSDLEKLFGLPTILTKGDQNIVGHLDGTVAITPSVGFTVGGAAVAGTNHEDLDWATLWMVYTKLVLRFE